MFILKDYEADKSLIRTEYVEDRKGIDYDPVRYDLLVFKCGFEFNYNEEALEKLIIDLNSRNLPVETIEEGFQSIGGRDVSVHLFRKTRYLAGNCFPINDQGRNYILLTCVENGEDVFVYKPDFAVVENDHIGICQIPLSVELVKFVPEKKGFFKLFGSKNQDNFSEYEFHYEVSSGYVDGDIYYTIEGFYPDDDERKLVIPITKEALDNGYICINCSSDIIKFGSKKRINLTIKE